jgi:hypothetical protein
MMPVACFAYCGGNVTRVVSLSAGILRPDFEQPEQLVKRLMIKRNIISNTGVALFF